MIKVALCHNETEFLCDAQSIYLQKLIPRLIERGISVTLFLISPRNPERCFLWRFCQDNGVPIRATPSLGSMTNNIRWLVGSARAIGADVVVTHHCHWALSAAASLRALRIPTIGVLHCEDEATERIVALYGVRGSPLLQSRFVAVSSGVAEMAKRTGAVVPVKTIPNGIEVGHLYCGWRTQPLKVCFFGRLVQQQKRILDLTHQFCDAAERLSGVEFHIWGGGEQEDEVRRILRRRAALLPVHLHGAITNPEVLAAMREHDVIVLLSEYEGLPFSLLEGMSCGLIPVVSDFDKSEDPLVVDGENGIVLEDYRSQFVPAIEALIKDPGLRQRLSMAARDRISADFGIGAWADSWAELIVEAGTSGDCEKLPRSERIAYVPRSYRLQGCRYFILPFDHIVKWAAVLRSLAFRAIEGFRRSVLIYTASSR